MIRITLADLPLPVWEQPTDLFLLILERHLESIERDVLPVNLILVFLLRALVEHSDHLFRASTLVEQSTRVRATLLAQLSVQIL